ncbi:papilin-like isoform X2 [Dermacentor silvarum]|uniref:papilin-like isoform X1 n=1 Tax=Dermacentor silvarum TaxID=543639 RepID=UPI0021011A2D|nr:papilin-like isoform X1 [Dermacentor silvarum]XP_049526507.1 papilin-like isoform X2 [Dermacentor silvarum]
MRILLSSFLTYYVVCFIPTDGNAASSFKRCSSMPLEDDNCESPLDKWYYNTDEQKCVNFMYGDCPQNNNIFASEEECQATCKNVGKGHQGSKGDRRPSNALGVGAKRPARGGSSSEGNEVEKTPGKSGGVKRKPPYAKGSSQTGTKKQPHAGIRRLQRRNAFPNHGKESAREITPFGIITRHFIYAA